MLSSAIIEHISFLGGLVMSNQNQSQKIVFPNGSIVEIPKLPDYSEAIESSQKLIATFLEIAEPLSQTFDSIKTNIEPVLTSFQTLSENYFKQLNDAINRIDFKRIHQAITDYADDMTRLKLILGEIKLFINPTYLSIHPSRIVNLYNQQGAEYTKRVLTRYICLFYNDYELNEFKQKWIRTAWLEKRKHFLTEIIDAHTNHLYAASVTLAFTQIEGIITDNVLKIKPKKLKVHSNDQREYLEKYLLDIESQEPFNVDNFIYDFFEEVLHIGFKLGQPLNSDLSRHAILHGYDLKYPSKINSLRLIILLDDLIDKITAKHNHSTPKAV